MSFQWLVVLFAVAVTAHNLEEAWLLPNWSKSSSKWVRSIGAGEFLFAAMLLTALAYICCALAYVGTPEGLGAYLVCGYALAMLLNVFVPHLYATVGLRRYAPGSATAILLVLPVTTALLLRGLAEGQVRWPRFLVVGPLVTVGITGAVPVLFRLARRLNQARLEQAGRSVPPSVVIAGCQLEQSPANPRSIPNQ